MIFQYVTNWNHINGDAVCWNGKIYIWSVTFWKIRNSYINWLPKLLYLQNEVLFQLIHELLDGFWWEGGGSVIKIITGDLRKERFLFYIHINKARSVYLWIILTYE